MTKLFISVITLIFIVINSTTAYSDTNTEKTKYLIKYVSEKISDLEKIKNRYDLIKDKEINSRETRLKEINKLLEKNKKTWEYNKHIPQIITQLKENNNLIKLQLKEKIKKKEDEAEKYAKTAHWKIRKTIKKTNKIVISIARELMKKEDLNNKDKEMVWILIQIKNKLEEMDSIKKKKWDTKKDIIKHVVSWFNQVSSNFKQIRKISKENT